MKAINHKVDHVYQPTNNTCGYASLSILLSYYGVTKSVEELTENVPQPKGEDGKPTGSVTPQLVQWCETNGLHCHMYAFDPAVLDISWHKLSSNKILERLKALKNTHVTRIMGKYWTKLYMQAYIDMIEAGAELTIKPTVSTELIYGLLQKGPVYANICSSVMSGMGRTREIALRKSVSDDTQERINNHSIVIYGNDTKGEFLVADPWSGLIKIDPELMICSITAAIVECDSQLFVIESKI